MSPVVLAVFGFATLLVLVSVLVPVAKRLDVPFTVLLVLVGATLGFVAGEGDAQSGMGRYLVSPLGELGIPAEGFLYVFLPPLLFAGGLTVDVRRLVDDIAPVMLLAIGAVLVCTATVGVALSAVTGTDLLICLLLGSIVATTDTAAVLGIFRDIGAPSRLSVIVEGESLFNDAAAIALFAVLLEVLTRKEVPGVLSGVATFTKEFVGGMILGYAMAKIAGWLISQLRGVAVTEITISVAFAYLIFVLGQAYLGVSGIIAVVTAAMVFASDVRTRLSPGTWGPLLTTWKQLEFWATSLIFVLAAMLTPRMLGQLHWSDIAGIAAIFLSALAARAALLWGMLPILSRFGLAQPVSGAYKLVLLWGSLRGAITVALALSVSETGSISADARRFIFVMAMGYVLATLFIAAPTLHPLMKLLKLDKLTPEERLVRDRVMALSHGRVRENLAQAARALGIAEALPPHSGPVEGSGQDAWMSQDDLVRAGLIVLGNRETELSLEYLQRGLVGRHVAERVRADSARMLDGARQNGTVGYLAAALRNQDSTWRFRLAHWLHRRFGWTGLLAEEIANRFEFLLVEQMVLRELMRFVGANVADLIGPDAALMAKEALEGRMQSTNNAIEALDLQYTDFTRAMRGRYLDRLSLGLEEAEYRGQLDQSLISSEVFEDLDEDRRKRQAPLHTRPALDLGLKLTEMLSKVSLFAELKGADIAKLGQMLTPKLFLPGELAMRAGDPGDRMYFIASGVVDVLVASNSVRLGSGDFFGEIALLTDKPRNADVVSAGYTNLLVLRRRDFETLLRSSPGLRDAIEKAARQRSQQTTQLTPSREEG
jgi:CPA1 family monovalent cation:H+ antiporter